MRLIIALVFRNQAKGNVRTGLGVSFFTRQWGVIGFVPFVSSVAHDEDVVEFDGTFEEVAADRRTQWISHLKRRADECAS